MSNFSFRFFVLGVIQHLPVEMECVGFTACHAIDANDGHGAFFTTRSGFDAEDVIYRIVWIEPETMFSVCQVDLGGEEIGEEIEWSAPDLEVALGALDSVMTMLPGECDEEADEADPASNNSDSDPAGVLRHSLMSLCREIVHGGLDAKIADAREAHGEVTQSDLVVMREAVVARLVDELNLASTQLPL